jgi:hypothetical protein
MYELQESRLDELNGRVHTLMSAPKTETAPAVESALVQMQQTQHVKVAAQLKDLAAQVQEQAKVSSSLNELVVSFSSKIGELTAFLQLYETEQEQKDMQRTITTTAQITTAVETASTQWSQQLTTLITDTQNQVDQRMAELSSDFSSELAAATAQLDQKWSTSHTDATTAVAATCAAVHANVKTTQDELALAHAALRTSHDALALQVATALTTISSTAVAPAPMPMPAPAPAVSIENDIVPVVETQVAQAMGNLHDTVTAAVMATMEPRMDTLHDTVTATVMANVKPQMDTLHEAVTAAVMATVEPHMETAWATLTATAHSAIATTVASTVSSQASQWASTAMAAMPAMVTVAEHDITAKAMNARVDQVAHEATANRSALRDLRLSLQALDAQMASTLSYQTQITELSTKVETLDSNSQRLTAAVKGVTSTMAAMTADTQAQSQQVQTLNVAQTQMQEQLSAMASRQADMQHEQQSQFQQLQATCTQLHMVQQQWQDEHSKAMATPTEPAVVVMDTTEIKAAVAEQQATLEDLALQLQQQKDSMAAALMPIDQLQARILDMDVHMASAASQAMAAALPALTATLSEAVDARVVSQVELQHGAVAAAVDAHVRDWTAAMEQRVVAGLEARVSAKFAQVDVALSGLTQLESKLNSHQHTLTNLATQLATRMATPTPAVSGVAPMAPVSGIDAMEQQRIIARTQEMQAWLREQQVHENHRKEMAKRLAEREQRLDNRLRRQELNWAQWRAEEQAAAIQRERLLATLKDNHELLMGKLK